MSATFSFLEKDKENLTIKPIVDKIVSLISRNISALDNYLIPLLNRTGNIESYKRIGHMLCDKFKVHLLGRDEKEIDKQMRLALKLDPDDWKKFRGTLAEKIIEPTFCEKHDNAKLFFGAATYINNELIKICRDENYKRQTVDAISWNDNIRKGFFMEIKFNPQAFEELTYDYLTLLDSKIGETDVKYKIQLLAFEDSEGIRSRISEINADYDYSNFEFISAIDYIFE